MKDALKKLGENLWTLPNVLTMLRMAMIPVFAVLYTSGHPYQALCVFILASLTDLLDGYLARKNNQVTAFGKLMDPLADKLMTCTVLVCLVVRKVFPLPALIIIAVKEMLMIIGGILVFRRGMVVYSKLIGKAATVLFVAAIILAFFHDQFVAWNFPLDRIFLWTAVATSVTAFVFYVVDTLKQMRENGTLPRKSSKKQ